MKEMEATMGLRYTSIEHDSRGNNTQRNWVSIEAFLADMEQNRKTVGDIQWAHCFRDRDGGLEASYGGTPSVAPSPTPDAAPLAPAKLVQIVAAPGFGEASEAGVELYALDERGGVWSFYHGPNGASPRWQACPGRTA
jgi:hypothetical protein